MLLLLLVMLALLVWFCCFVSIAVFVVVVLLMLMLLLLAVALIFVLGCSWCWSAKRGEAGFRRCDACWRRAQELLRLPSKGDAMLKTASDFKISGVGETGAAR